MGLEEARVQALTRAKARKLPAKMEYGRTPKDAAANAHNPSDDQHELTDERKEKKKKEPNSAQLVKADGILSV